MSEPMVLDNQELLNGQSENGDQLDDDNGDNDMISNLPEPLLRHILSFLPTKTVALTCILSKRWMHLWTTIPDLDFNSWYKPKHILEGEDSSLYVNRFMDFVDRTLHLHDMSNIKKFSLNCNRLSNYSRMNTWISSILKRKVEELTIQDSLKDFLPSCLFTCETLTKLELFKIRDVSLPQSIFFPRLKILRLVHVWFNDSIDQLISNCPVLQELVIVWCRWKNEKIAHISGPTLLRFACAYPPQPVKIWAPNLLALVYKGSLAHIHVLPRFSSLRRAAIQVCSCEKNEDEIIREKLGGMRLLQQFFNVKHLSFEGDTYKHKAFSFIHESRSLRLPTFSNLTVLEVNPNLLCPTNKELLNLLQNSPKLEALVFSKVFLPYSSEDGDGESALDTVHTSLLLNLKSVKFVPFDGNTREMCVVNFFLKNATVLQTMTIVKSIKFTYFSPAPTENMSQLELMEDKLKILESTLKIKEEKLKVVEEVVGLPRASSSCVIKFVDAHRL